MIGYVSQKKLGQMFETVRVPWHWLIVRVGDKLGYEYLCRLADEKRCKCSILYYDTMIYDENTGDRKVKES